MEQKRISFFASERVPQKTTSHNYLRNGTGAEEPEGAFSALFL